jgi:hypothetical protein
MTETSPSSFVSPGEERPVRAEVGQGAFWLFENWLIGIYL